MSVKTVTLTEAAYDAHPALKNEGVNFIKVVRRLGGSRILLSPFAGAWSDVPRRGMARVRNTLEDSDRLSNARFQSLDRGRSATVVSLGSSFVIDLLDGDASAVERARRLEEQTEPRYIAAPAAREVRLGGCCLGGARFERTYAMVDGLPLLPIDRDAYHTAALLGAELIQCRSPIGHGDLYVAASTRRAPGTACRTEPV